MEIEEITSRVLRSVSVLTILASFFCGYGQNQLHMTNYTMHQPLFNSASMASYGNINGAVICKRQWVGIEGAPAFQGISLGLPHQNGKDFAGILVFNDKIGVNSRSDIALNYAHKFQVSDKQWLSLGMGFDLAFLQSDLSSVHTITENDPLFGSNTPTVVAPNANFGAYFFSEQYYLGFSMPRLLKNRIAARNNEYYSATRFEAPDIHYNFHAGRRFRLNEDFNILSSFLIKAVSGSPIQADLNVLLELRQRFGVGASCRTTSMISAILTYSIARSWSLGYTYDYNFNELSTFSKGSHEFMLIFNHKSDKENILIETPRL